jgi:predicted transcriptional regulator
MKMTDSHARQLLAKYETGDFIYSPAIVKLVNELIKAGYITTTNNKSYGLTQMGRSWCMNHHQEYSHLKVNKYIYR